MKLIERLQAQSWWRVETLVRIACYLAVVALLLMVWSALVPAALPVVLGMSLGQGLGILAVLFYLAAVITDAALARRASSVRPPPSRD